MNVKIDVETMGTKAIVTLCLEEPTQANFNIIFGRNLTFNWPLVLSLIYEKTDDKPKFMQLLRKSLLNSYWNSLYGRSFGGLKIEAYRMTSETQRSLDYWISVYFDERYLKDLAVSKIKSSDAEFEKWKNAFNYFILMNEKKPLVKEEFEMLKSLILPKLIDKVLSFEQCEETFDCLEKWKGKAPLAQEDFENLQTLMVCKMEKNAVSFEHWESISKKSSGDIGEKAFDKLKKLM